MQHVVQEDNAGAWFGNLSPFPNISINLTYFNIFSASFHTRYLLETDDHARARDKRMSRSPRNTFVFSTW